MEDAMEDVQLNAGGRRRTRAVTTLKYKEQLVSVVCQRALPLLLRSSGI